MGGVGVEEAAAIGAELLDRLLAGDRAKRDGLLGAFERGGVDRAGQGLRHAERDEGERDHDSDRQQDIERGPGQIDPEIAERRRAVAGEGAGHRDGEGDAGRGREEIMHGQAGHLREMAHGRLAAIGLPVGVGQEADRGVEGEIGRDIVEMLRIERQKSLQPQDRIKRGEARRGEDQHGDRIGEPVLLALRRDAGEPVEGRARPGRGPAKERCARRKRRAPYKGRADAW